MTLRSRRSAFLLVSLAFASFASPSAAQVGPDARGAPPATSASPASPLVPSGPSAAVAPTNMERVSLDAAVKRALEHNTDVGTAIADVRRSEGLLEQARAPAMPTLYGNGVYTHLDSARFTEGVLAVPQNSLNLNGTLTVPIIAPQRWAFASHASENLDIAKSTLESVRRVVAVTTARAYLTVVRQRRVVEVNELARDTARAQYEYSHTRRVGGVGNRLDEVRAAQEVSSNSSLVAAALVTLAQAREALGVLAGSQSPIEPSDEGAIRDSPPVRDAIANVESRRVDIRELDRRLTAAEHVERDNWADYSPYLIGVGQVFYQTPTLATTPQTGWQVQLGLTVPIYDGGLRYGYAKEREGLTAAARVGRDGALRQAKSDIRAAAESVKRADESLAQARDAAKFANEARELASLAYRAGATTNLEVIDAERAARDADTQVALAEDTARQARLDLAAASGVFP